MWWFTPGPMTIGDSKLVGEDRVNEAVYGIEKELLRKAIREQKKEERKLMKQNKRVKKNQLMIKKWLYILTLLSVIIIVPACGGIDSIPINSGTFMAISSEPDSNKDTSTIVTEIILRWRKQEDDENLKPYFIIQEGHIAQSYHPIIFKGTMSRDHGKIIAYPESGGGIVFDIISETKFSYNENLTDKSSRLNVPDSTEFLWINEYDDILSEFGIK